MPPARPSPGSLRERLFLAFGLGSALILVLAAVAVGGDPESAGRAELVSTAARIAEAVKVQWEDGRVVVPFVRTSRATLLEWTDGKLPFAEGHELVPESGSGHEVFDALFAKSEQFELVSSDPAGALELVLDALDKTTDPARHAEARLRAVQLAVKATQPAVAREQYLHACAEIDASERRGRASYLMLLAIAVGPAIGADDRPEFQRELASLMNSGKLAWKLDPPRSALQEDPEISSLCALLETTSPGCLPAHFAQLRTAQALRADLGELRMDVLNGAAVMHAGGRFFVTEFLDSGRYAGCYLEVDTVREALGRAVAQSRILPDGFVVDVDPPQSKAKAVREHDALDGDFGFTVKHEDPEGWIRKSAARQKLLRVALLVLALLSAAAGVATFRALRRERTLAELKTDFVANVSHELRTPLASILLLSENLEAGRVTKPEDAARYHALIRREALRLRRLVDDVLDFSRLERGKHLEVHREALRLDPWLEHVFEELGAWAREHALELALSRSPTDSDAEVDGEALRRALLNLLDNARKHSGGTQVELSALREGRELVLRVRDHGRGILPADRERVFEPFTRLDGGEAPGAGLGLSIVREIAREHGGVVRALDPESGPGIVFEMRIPLAEETAA